MSGQEPRDRAWTESHATTVGFVLVTAVVAAGLSLGLVAFVVTQVGVSR